MFSLRVLEHKCKIVLLKAVLIIGLLICWDLWLKGLEGKNLVEAFEVS